MRDRVNIDHLRWRLVVPLSADDRVLNLSPNVDSRLLAELCGSVTQVGGRRPAEAGASSHGKEVDGIEYVEAIDDLVSAKSSFNLAILYGLQDWLACARSAQAACTQLGVLRKIRALLRPRGYFCLGVENRWYYRYLLGASGPCADPPFVIILPQSIVGPLCGWRTGRPCVAFAQSARGYRRLLNKAGFEDLRLLCAIPDFRNPKFIVPLEAVPYAYFREHFASGPRFGLRDIAIRALGHCRLDRLLVHSFLIIAR